MMYFSALTALGVTFTLKRSIPFPFSMNIIFVNVEWYVFFQHFWVQGIMSLIFAFIFGVLVYYEINSKDELIMRIVPPERPSSELFCSIYPPNDAQH